jgi:hypothetical protein
MFTNRLSTEALAVRIPQPPPAPVTPAGFLMCPLAVFPPASMGQWLCQQWLYQRAFELAQAVVRPSLPERDLLGVWN